MLHLASQAWSASIPSMPPGLWDGYLHRPLPTLFRDHRHSRSSGELLLYSGAGKAAVPDMDVCGIPPRLGGTLASGGLGASTHPEPQQSQLTQALRDTAEVAQAGDSNYTDLSCQPRASGTTPADLYQPLTVFREPFLEFCVDPKDVLLQLGSWWPL